MRNAIAIIEFLVIFFFFFMRCDGSFLLILHAFRTRMKSFCYFCLCRIENCFFLSINQRNNPKLKYLFAKIIVYNISRFGSYMMIVG